MAQPVLKSCARLLLCAAMFSFGTAASAEPMSIRQLGLEQLRLATIAYRLSVANAQTCANPAMTTGLVLHDLTQYQPNMRPAIAQAFSLHAGIGVLQLVHGSEADGAGFRIDDEILAVNGASLEADAATMQPSPSSHRMEGAVALLDRSLQSAPADVLVRRAGKLLRLQLRGAPSCGGTAYLVNSGELNAWSDGGHVFVSTAMMRLAADDSELAFVIGHEMAHNILGHSSEQSSHGLLSVFGVGAARVRREESAADAFAVTVMRQGGYPSNGAVTVLTKLERTFWWSLSLDHPSFASRIENVISTMRQGVAPAISSRYAETQLAAAR